MRSGQTANTWHPCAHVRQTYSPLFLQVLVGAHTLLANGGIIAPAGTALVALAAKKHAVPLVVLVVSVHTSHNKAQKWGATTVI